MAEQKITPKIIEDTAASACLYFDENELSAYGKDLQAMLNFFEELETVDTTHIEPMTSPHQLPQPLRDDTVTEIDQHAVFNKLVRPEQIKDDMYVVPQVIE